jgi:probable rRNA maturation factor
MNVSVDIDDTSWLAIDNLEAETRRIADHCARAIDFGRGPTEAAILFTDDDNVAELNRTWRGKQGPTNVLSFRRRCAITPLISSSTAFCILPASIT